jgi:hypothetical protein
VPELSCRRCDWDVCTACYADALKSRQVLMCDAKHKPTFPAKEEKRDNDSNGGAKQQQQQHNVTFDLIPRWGQASTVLSSISLEVSELNFVCFRR